MMGRRSWWPLAAVLAMAACGDSAESVVEDADSVAVESEASAPSSAAESGIFLDPNAVPAERLLLVPGFDQPLAEAVVQGRPYADMRAVDAVLSTRLSEGQRDTAYLRLWKPVDVNTATVEELRLIPGVDDATARAIERARPIRDAEHLREALSGQVDAVEVAHLERYVVIR
jgi:DNA uptake protein ComE-like DNA-binding protein